ncbi:MAG TPA: CHASE2 domain-containing protein [Treponemataceae bacterium]|nr:CHASE2 domain-containing protein [Treponemataceae bacterium]
MKRYLYLIVPFIAVLLCSLLLFTSLDNKINDIFLRTTPSLKESDSVLLINVDDFAIERVGNFPWTRDVLADAIIYMKEMGAEFVLFDLNYLDRSPVVVNPDYVKVELPGYLDYGFNQIDNTIAQVLDAAAEQYIAPDELPAYKDEILAFNKTIKNSLEANIAYVTTDVDEYFAQTLSFFGNSYLTITMIAEEHLMGEDTSFNMEGYDIDWLENVIALKNIDGSKDTLTPEFIGITPAIELLLRSAKSAGFVNADPDPDGYRRRLHLVAKYDGRYYGQFSFVPLLEYFGNPQVVVTDASITLKDVNFKNSIKDIVIPRCEDGSVLIKWPAKTYNDYNAISAWEVIKNIEIEEDLIKGLRNLQDAGFFMYWTEDDTPVELYDNAEYIKTLLYDGEDPDNGLTIDVYRDYRTNFYDSAAKFLSPDYENLLLADAEGQEELIQYITESFANLRNFYNVLSESRAFVKTKLDGAFCIIGTTATSTIDVGLTMYEERFPNVGIHATIANMIYAQEFLDDTPGYVSIIIALLLSLFLGIATKQLDAKKSMLAGLATVIISVGTLLLFFVITKKYIGVIVPLTSVSLTFISLTVISLFSNIREKSFLRNAFSRYLSPDVINEIINDPSKLNLGGEKREMTALFTDIKGFSTISERMQPVELVNLLNKYLTDMSNIILDFRGTIDKYEGDAIIAFFGAPIAMEDHADRACRSAIRMKKAEQRINDELMQTAGLLPFPLFTRVGINTGEMVVGNMGTANKMDYTMIGNAVNLAARLEGVNKQYNTKGILISEHTKNRLTPGQFIMRALDRVRVVGVATPLRLYELLEESEFLTENLREQVEFWGQAIELYETRRFTEAKEVFQRVMNRDMSDQVAALYIERCEKFIASPPEDSWDGVFNLTQK